MTQRMGDRWRRKLLGALCLSGLLVANAGCGDESVPTYPAAGQVTFADGDPVRFGVVELRSVDRGVTARGKIERDGTFVLGTRTSSDGAVAGRHQAIVVQHVSPNAAPQPLDESHSHGPTSGLAASKYADFATSSLEVEIVRGENAVSLVVDRAP